jgi:GH24 family phage-related lysozyme (muramidase)
MESFLIGFVSLISTVVQGPIDEDLIHRTAQFIALAEGKSLIPYQDSEGLAVCHGAKAQSWDDIKTDQECWDMVVESAELILNFVDENIDRPMTDNQWISIASFSYNVKNPERLFQYINEDNPTDEEIAEEIRLYSYSGGIWLKGLANRRMREAELFLKP